jgi:lipopolysaccharide transport system ATP-binding protein
MSSNDVAVAVRGLSKSYTIAHNAAKHTMLGEALMHRIKNPLQRAGKETFWALKDVEFDIKKGDVVGIIGRNGAGKSTLLKVLSQITEPTTGEVRLYGRVGSLLEVGTGFHPELTGRENIYLNGAILGMRRSEIDRQFEAIVDFAEVEQFLDTPVKRYSSGMYVRLAFAVAAHLNPQILIVDEVLAVGDAAFQKKCLGKMQDVSKQEGRTVLFVSHNMGAIQTLCNRAIVLQQGRLIANQSATEAVHTYLQNAEASMTFTRPQQQNGKPTIISGDAENSETYVQINLQVFSERQQPVCLNLRLTDGAGMIVGFGSLGSYNPEELIRLQPGSNLISFQMATTYLAIGSYMVNLDLTLPDVEFYDRLENALLIDVVRPPLPGMTRALSQSWGYGSVEIPLQRN